MTPYLIIAALVGSIAAGVLGYFKGYTDSETAFEAKKVALMEQIEESKKQVRIEDRIVIKEVIKYVKQADTKAQQIRDKITNEKPSIVWSVPSDDVRVWNDSLCAGYMGAGAGGVVREAGTSNPTSGNQGSSKQGGSASQSTPKCG